MSEGRGKKCTRFNVKAAARLEAGEELESHYKSCEECMAEIASYRRLSALVADAGRFDETGPEWEAKILEGIRAREAKPGGFVEAREGIISDQIAETELAGDSGCPVGAQMHEVRLLSPAEKALYWEQVRSGAMKSTPIDPTMLQVMMAVFSSQHSSKTPVKKAPAPGQNTSRGRLTARIAVGLGVGAFSALIVWIMGGQTFEEASDSTAPVQTPWDNPPWEAIPQPVPGAEQPATPVASAKQLTSPSIEMPDLPSEEREILSAPSPAPSIPPEIPDAGIRFVSPPQPTSTMRPIPYDKRPKPTRSYHHYARD